MRQLLSAGITFALLLGTHSRPVHAQEGSPSFRFITPEAIAVVVAHPKRAIEGPGTELYPREIITAAGLHNLGIDPLQIEQLLAFVEAPVPPGPPAFGVVLEMSAAQDPNKILPALMQAARPANLAGKPFYSAVQRSMPSVMLPDDRTIVIAPEATLAKMMNAQAADSPLLKLLRAAPADRHVLTIAVLDPIRDLLRGQLAAAPPLPLPFERFKQLPEHLSSIELRLNVATSMDSELILRSPSAAAAQQVHEMLITALTMGKQLVQAQVARQAASQDPVEQATARYAQRLTEHFAGLLQPKLDGERVTLVVKGEGNVATSGVLVALLLPAVQAAREAARRGQGVNNLKQIALALHNHHDVHRKFPARAATDAGGKPLLSWRVAVLPFLASQALYDRFKLDEPWDSEHNKQLIPLMPSVFQLPGSAAGDGKTPYLLPAGPGTLNENPNGLRMADVTDGVKNTILCMEARPDRAVIWTRPDDLEVNLQQPLEGLAGARPGGFQAVLGDGVVKFISDNIDLQLLRALFSPAGGEAVQLPP